MKNIITTFIIVLLCNSATYLLLSQQIDRRSDRAENQRAESRKIFTIKYDSIKKAIDKNTEALRK